MTASNVPAKAGASVEVVSDLDVASCVIVNVLLDSPVVIYVPPVNVAVLVVSILLVFVPSDNIQY